MKGVSKKIRVFFILLCCLMLSVSVICLIDFSKEKRVFAATIVHPEGDAVNNVYFLNETIDIQGLKVSVNDVNYDIYEQVLVYPDGVAYTAGTHVLDVVGKYTLRCYANVDGRSVLATLDFNVVKEAFEVGIGATAEYVNDLTKKDGVDNGGLAVTLTEGTEFKYNQVIDLASNDLSLPLIELYPYNKNTVWESYLDENGVIAQRIVEDAIVQCRIITIRITDCYDLDNYVDITIDWNLASPNHPTLAKRREATCLSGANGQNKTALIPNPSLSTNKWYANKEIDGDPYLFVMGGSYGKSSSYDGKDGISFYYENDTNRVYIQDKNGKSLLTDLDDPNLYSATPYLHEGNQYITGEPFKGFSTGEVYLSIFGSEYFTNNVQFEIASIQGVNGQALSEKAVKDDVAPTLDINVTNVDKIYIAKGEEFPLFDAKVYDLHGIRELKKAVWFNYNTERQSLVNVENDVFVPTNAGTYTIEYIAIDTYGNKTLKTVEVSAIDAPNGTTINFDLNIASTDISAGETHNLPYTIYGLNGEPDFVAYYTFWGDDTLTKMDIDSENKTIKFRPLSLGKYVLTFICNDGIVEKTIIQEINSVASDNVSLTSLVLPEYLIAGMSYTFDYNEIVFYDGQTQPQKPTVYVSIDGQEKTVINYENYTVPKSASKVQFIYQSGDREIERSEEIQVIDVGFGESLAMEKYFVGDFSVNKKSSSDISFKSNKDEGDNILKFINPVSLNNFNLSFTVPLGGMLFDSLDITVVDYQNRDLYNNYSFAKNLDNTNVVVSNQDGKIVSYTIAKQLENGIFNLQYNSTTGMSIYGLNEKLGLISFGQDRVLIYISLKGLRGNGLVGIKQINNQPISDSSWDAYSANITNYSIVGSLKIGEKITILPSVATDVLSPFLKQNFRFIATDHNGDIIKSEDGIYLNAECDPLRAYEIKLNEYGQYALRYIYTDQAGETVYSTVILTVSDEIPPTLNLQEGYGENKRVIAKVGDVHKLATYNISDNFTATENLNLQIVVVTPRYEFINYTSSKLALELSGQYKIYYYCTDEQGNYTVRYYTIAVKECE